MCAVQVHRKVLLEAEPWAIAEAAGGGGCRDDYVMAPFCRPGRDLDVAGGEKCCVVSHEVFEKNEDAAAAAAAAAAVSRKTSSHSSNATFIIRYNVPI